MKKRDFVDKDLLDYTGKEETAETPDVADEETTSASGVSDLDLGRLARQRQKVTSGMVGAIDELERLRQRQQDLEQEKRDLEELATKQDEYVQGKREMVAHLNEGILALEKKEVQTAQLTDLISATRTRFKEALTEIEAIDEDQWPDDKFRDELYKALVIIDDARMEYNKALARIEVLEGGKETVLQAAPVAMARAEDVEHSFGYWVMVGLGVTLPITVLAIILSVVFVVFRTLNWI